MNHPGEKSDGSYAADIRAWNEWHVKMQRQLILSSLWISAAYAFIAVSMAGNYHRAGGPHTEWLAFILGLLLVLSLMEQLLFWQWIEKKRSYTLSLAKDVLLACRQRARLRLTLFIIYLITFALMLTTTATFSYYFIRAYLPGLVVQSLPSVIVIFCLCLYNIYQCRRDMDKFDGLLRSMHGREN